MQVLPFMRFGPIHEVQKKMRHMMQIRCSGGADAKTCIQGTGGPPRILEAGASLELLEPLEMREGVHSESVLGGR